MVISEAIKRLEELRDFIGRDAEVVIASHDQSHHREDVQYEAAAFECQNVTACACGFVAMEKNNDLQVVAVW